MRTKSYFLPVFGLAMSALMMTQHAEAQSVQPGPTELRVDDLRLPLGIDDATPRFSWQLRDAQRGARQTAYQVEVASSAAALSKARPTCGAAARSTGKSMNVSYHGPALAAGKRYYWRVKVWDAAGKLYPQSEVAGGRQDC